MTNPTNQNLWLSIIAGVGVLLGVGLGAYVAQDSTLTNANTDGPPMCFETEGEAIVEACTDGQWTPWNLTDQPKVFPQFWGVVVQPHSRSYVGVRTVTTKTRQYICGQAEEFRTLWPWRETVQRSNTVCHAEQQDLVDPETDVTTINEAPDCNGPECDIPPSF